MLQYALYVVPNEAESYWPKMLQQVLCVDPNRPFPIYQNSNLAPRLGGIKQKK